MKEPKKFRLQKAKENLLKKLPLKKIKQIPKYKNLTMEQYLRLIDKLETMALFVIDNFLENH